MRKAGRDREQKEREKRTMIYDPAKMVLVVLIVITLYLIIWQE